MKTLSHRKKLFVVILAVLSLLVALAAVWYNLFQKYAQSPFEKVDTSALTNKLTQNEFQAEKRISMQYLSEVLMLNGSDMEHSVNTIEIPWDDSWFYEPSDKYNHELAQFCIAASALANGESLHFENEELALSEQSLSALGFEDIDTKSYAHASTSAQEVDNVFLGQTDEVAYVIAHKKLPGYSYGKQDELVLLAIRGTYGTEWLSNFKVSDTSSWLGESESHTGYRLAELDMLGEVLLYMNKHQLTEDHTKMLVCGHSRGASVANLFAADIIDAQYVHNSKVIDTKNNLYAYCFATSPTTQDENSHDSRYDVIFNICNPTDIVPFVPLSKWGYSVFGRIAFFPGPDDEDFTIAYEKMNNQRALNTGYLCVRPYEAQINPTEQLFNELSEVFPSIESTKDPANLTKAAEILSHYDLYRMVASHFPDTYIAWLQTANKDDLTWK